MQCPTCEHEAPIAAFGDPLRCPECGAFYEKAVQLKAKKDAATAAASTQASHRRNTGGVAPANIGTPESIKASNRTWTTIFAIFSVLLVIGAVKFFASSPSVKSQSEKVSAANNKPDPVTTYKILKIAQDNVRARLKDPASATFKGEFVAKTGIPCGEVNSKNSFGGYTGYQRYMASGGGLAVLESDMAPEEFDKAWLKLCR